VSQSRYEWAVRYLHDLRIPIDAPAEDVERRVFEAYPWGERSHHPYKAWLRAVKTWRQQREKLRALGWQPPTRTQSGAK